MKFKLEVGTELELLTQDELAEKLAPLVDAMNASREPPLITREYAQVTTSASGTIALGLGPAPIYHCPLGMRADLLRTSISAVGYSASNPLTTGELDLYVNSVSEANRVNFAPVGGVVAPLLFTEGDAAFRLKEGDELVVSGSGLPANVTFNFSLQLRLWETVRATPEQKGWT